jgi:hypothetical protein
MLLDSADRLTGKGAVGLIRVNLKAAAETAQDARDAEFIRARPSR